MHIIYIYIQIHDIMLQYILDLASVQAIGTFSHFLPPLVMPDADEGSGLRKRHHFNAWNSSNNLQKETKCKRKF